MATARRETFDPLPSSLESKSQAQVDRQLQLARSLSSFSSSRSTKRQSALASSLAEGRDATWKVRRSQLPNEEIFVDAHEEKEEEEDEEVFLEAIQTEERERERELSSLFLRQR